MPTKILPPFHILFSFSIFLPLAASTDFDFPAVFNFGDSNSDTGELVAALGIRLDPPNGQTYFKAPVGRFCDGRLIVDFLSKLATHHCLGKMQIVQIGQIAHAIYVLVLLEMLVFSHICVESVVYELKLANKD